jgi:hypothetical protein
MQQALFKISHLRREHTDDEAYAIEEALHARLAQPEPEPVAWMWTVNNGGGFHSRGIGFEQTDIPFAKHAPLYTAPPQREFIGLTDKELKDIFDCCQRGDRGYVAAMVEAKLREKNG